MATVVRLIAAGGARRDARPATWTGGIVTGLAGAELYDPKTGTVSPAGSGR